MTDAPKANVPSNDETKNDQTKNDHIKNVPPAPQPAIKPEPVATKS